jgi:hypothetical protein
MKKFTRLICLLLALMTMALFAMGSGSSSSSDLDRGVKKAKDIYQNGGYYNGRVYSPHK